jgi:hypothetical protein
MRRLQAGVLTVAVGALVISAAGCGSTAAEPAAAPVAPPAEAAPVAEPAAETVVTGEGRDRTASTTADDWATYADHVLVVTVADEVRHRASPGEIERGEGMIGRTVKLRVDKVLWSAPDAPQPAPARLDLSAAGWVFNDGEGRADGVKFALRHSSRLDKGHTYVKAVEWIDDPCSDDPKQGSWEGLGSGDTIPYDKGVLGAGEFEGQTQTLAEAKAKFRAHGAAVPSDLRAQMAGASLDKLTAGLKSAKPGKEEGYGPRECNPEDR